VIKELLAVIRQHEVGLLVLGLPYELDGSLGLQGRQTKLFELRLAKALKKDPDLKEIAIEFFDERFTSAQAERVIAGTRLKNRDRRAALDRVAAALILESYLEQRR
jgi:putative Holliday junction resolvase